MNVFRRELKAHRWALLFWCIGIVAMVSSGMAKYSAYEAAGQSMEQIIAQIPEAVRAVFGFGDFDLTTAAGFYGVLFLYLAVMAGVHAALLGSTLISKEERDRTSEFLYAKPASRNRILTAKLLAGLFNLVVFNLATLASSFYFVDYYNKDEPFDSTMLVLMAGLFFLQSIFFSIGALVAGSARKPRSAASRATSVMFLAFLVSFMINLNEDLDFLRYFTPFKYFDAATLMAEGRLDPGYVALSVAIVVAAVFGAYRFYSARDLTV